MAYLCHKSISTGAFLILKNNILIIIGHKIPESGIIPAYASVSKSAGSERVLAEVRYMLLEDEWGKLPWSSTSASASSWPAGRRLLNQARYHHPPPRHEQIHDRYHIAPHYPNTTLGLSESSVSLTSFR